MRLPALALLVLLAAGGWAAETPAAPSAAVTAFNQAMGGQDATAKKKAVKALVAKDAGSDDVILPLLVGALDDRQAGETALEALRSRTGLTAPTNKRVGGPGYPGYPKDDSSGSWSGWLAERTKAVEQERLVKQMKDKEKKPDGKPATEGGEEAAPVTTVKPKSTTPDADLGSIDRVILKSGGSLLCYVLSKRTDADGNLISVRIAHPDGGGEEVLQADLIARLEEDVQ